MSRFDFELNGLSWAILLPLLLAALLWILLGYRRERRLVPAWVGRTSTALRAAAAAAVLLLFAEAALRVRRVVKEPGEVLIILDASRSMERKDLLRPAWQKVEEARALGFLGPSSPEPGADEAARRRHDAELAAGGGDAVRAAISRVESLGRLELARAILASGGERSLLARLRGRFRVLVSSLADGPAAEAAELRENQLPRPGDDSSAAFPLPASDFTDLGRPVLDRALLRPRATLAGVLLITDGRHNQGPPPAEALAPLRALGVPLFPLGVGAEEAPADLRIVEVEAPEIAFAGDEVSISLAVESSGLAPAAAGGSIPIAVRVAEGEKILQEIPVEIPPSGTVRLPLSFTPPPEAPAEAPAGPRRFSVSIPLQAGEATEENNRAEFWMEIRKEKIRVLLLDGGPRWEYRYLRAGLEKDPAVTLEALLVTRPPDRRLPAEFPRGREELFARDVFILGDVEASVFSREDLEAVRDLVTARGSGLILIAGERAMPDDFAGSSLEEILPVRLRRPRPAPGAGASLGRSGFRPLLTPEGERSPILRLAPGREPNRELWSLLPPLDWFAPVLEARARAVVLAGLPPELLARAAPARDSAPAPIERVPGAADGPKELAADSARRGPILATLEAGAGRVLFSAIDSTWKWRFRSGDRLPARFWGQAVRWAASGRLPPGDGVARLATDRKRYEGRSTVEVRALLAGPDGKSIDGGAVEAVLRPPPGGVERRLPLEAAPGSGGLLRGALEIDPSSSGSPPGEYRLQLEIPSVPGYSAKPDRAEARFRLDRPPSRESIDPTRDGPLLLALARGSGGTYLPLERAEELPDLIPDRSADRERISRIDAWDHSWAVLLAVAALLTAEWGLRKKFDLN